MKNIKLEMLASRLSDSKIKRRLAENLTNDLLYSLEKNNGGDSVEKEEVREEVDSLFRYKPERYERVLEKINDDKDIKEDSSKEIINQLVEYFKEEYQLRTPLLKKIDEYNRLIQKNGRHAGWGEYSFNIKVALNYPDILNEFEEELKDRLYWDYLNFKSNQLHDLLVDNFDLKNKIDFKGRNNGWLIAKLNLLDATDLEDIEEELKEMDIDPDECPNRYDKDENFYRKLKDIIVEDVEKLSSMIKFIEDFKEKTERKEEFETYIIIATAS